MLVFIVCSQDYINKPFPSGYIYFIHTIQYDFIVCIKYNIALVFVTE